jgi:hypothetical protein
VIEYVIYGIHPNETEEQILMTKFNGETIVSKIMANNLVKILENKYNCTNLRIFELNLNLPNVNELFIKALNI